VRSVQQGVKVVAQIPHVAANIYAC
jgi:hypothetical protein